MNKERKKMNKIVEFFNTIYGLILFTIKSIYILIREDMKKEAQTYKEEREQQKRQEEGRKKRRVGLKHE